MDSFSILAKSAWVRPFTSQHHLELYLRTVFDRRTNYAGLTRQGSKSVNLLLWYRMVQLTAGWNPIDYRLW
jgi:hypothetical protein